MTNYDFSEEFFKKQNEQIVNDWTARLIFDVSKTLGFHYFNSLPTDNTYDEKVKFCYESTHILLEEDWYKLSKEKDFCPQSFIKILKERKRYFLKIINGNKNLIEKFFDSSYCGKIWSNEINMYIKNIVYTKVFDYPRVRIKRDKEYILNQWKAYKQLHKERLKAEKDGKEWDEYSERCYDELPKPT
jgi:hypothetical protein